MFEKDAEEYANEYGQDAFTQVHMPQMIEPVRIERKLGFQKGAEFGYNKANDWHYVKDGDYPKDESKVLCILGDFENDNLEVGYYSQVEGDSKRWRFEDYDLPDDSENGWGVSAWKEIVLPKESK